MKRLSVLLLVVSLFMAVAAMSVSAALTTVPVYSSTSPTWGSATQVASDPKADDDIDKNITVSTTISGITNPGLGVITLAGFVPIAGFSTSDLEVVQTGATSPTAITLRARITEKLDAVDADLNLVAIKVGTATLTANAGVDNATVDVYMQRQNNLELDRIEVEVESVAGSKNTERIDVDGGDELKDLRPGDTLQFDVQAINNFDTNSNVQIKSITAKVDIKDDINDHNDETISDLSEDDKDSAIITIEVPDDTDEGTNSGTITLVGKDRFGARHGDKTDFDAKVVRDRHDIQVAGISLNPLQLDCSDTSMQVSVKLHNLGRTDEDDVAVEVFGKTLGISGRRTALQMDKDDSETEVFDFQVNPTQLDSGVHAIQIQTFTDNSELSNTEVAQITNNCKNGIVPPSEENKPTLTLEKNTFEGTASGSVSVPVQVKNNDNVARSYTIAIANADDFAEPTSSKTINLNPGQTSTVYMNVKMKDDVKAGSYSATVNVKSGSDIVASDTVNVAVGKSASSTSIPSYIWIIAEIALIVLAVIFLVLIFRGRD